MQVYIKSYDDRIFDKDLKEKKVHGTKELPIAFYESSFLKYDKFNTHWHKEVEVVHVCSGKMVVKINHKSYYLNEDDFIIINKCALHSLQKDIMSKDIVVFKTLLFDLYLLSSNLREHSQKEVVEKIDENKLDISKVIEKDSLNHSIFKKYFYEMKESFEKKLTHYEIEMKAYIHLLMYLILNIKSTEAFPGKRIPKIPISKTVDLINKNIEINYTIKELADFIGYSEAYYMREFKKNIGLTVKQFTNKKKIEYAKVLLLSTEENVRDIAGRCGYDNISYFSRVFKELENVTPLQYRKAYRQ